MYYLHDHRSFAPDSGQLLAPSWHQLRRSKPMVEAMHIEVLDNEGKRRLEALGCLDARDHRASLGILNSLLMNIRRHAEEKYAADTQGSSRPLCVTLSAVLHCRSNLFQQSSQGVSLEDMQQAVKTCACHMPMVANECPATLISPAFSRLVKATYGSIQGYMTVSTHLCELLWWVGVSPTIGRNFAGNQYREGGNLIILACLVSTKDPTYEYGARRRPTKYIRYFGTYFFACTRTSKTVLIRNLLPRSLRLTEQSVDLCTRNFENGLNILPC